MNFTVHWDIDVEADTPEEAALLAASMARSPGTTATIYEVVTDQGSVYFDTEGDKAVVFQDLREPK